MIAAGPKALGRLGPPTAKYVFKKITFANIYTHKEIWKKIITFTFFPYFVNAWPQSKRDEKTTTVVASLCWTTCRGNNSCAHKAPLEIWRCKCARVWCVAWFAQSSRCSLSWWRRVFVYLWRCGRNFGQILRESPKESETAINHWVFLRCDWSPVIFPNLIWMAKKKKNLDS